MAALSTTESAADVLGDVSTGLFIGGSWRDAASGTRFDVENPATGETIASVADATEDDALAALDAADAAQRGWAATPPRERAEILRRGFDLITAHADEIATLMTLEMGKPLAESQGEVAYGAEFVRWFSEEATRLQGRSGLAPEGTLRMMTARRPVGPCLLITPWNFPLAMATRKVAPALAAGCTVVLKPAQLTPLCSLRFASLMQEAGVPDGVLNVVTASSASTISEPLLADARLRKLSFTGSTAVGKKLMASAAENMLRTSMELGGNAPAIVFEDADLDRAVDGCLAAKLRNGGEACTAANRILVHESIAEELTERFTAGMEARVLGDGLDENTTLGPMIDDDAVEKIHELIDDAVAKGARVVTGGDRLDRPGHFVPATVLTDIPDDARLLREEIFGPVAPIVTFADEDEAMAQANGTEYGLASYVFTRGLDRALRIGDRLDFGLVGVNAGVISNAAAPFGGMKHSGTGREGGAEGIEEYLETQYRAFPV